MKQYVCGVCEVMQRSVPWSLSALHNDKLRQIVTRHLLLCRHHLQRLLKPIEIHSPLSLALTLSEDDISVGLQEALLQQSGILHHLYELNGCDVWHSSSVHLEYVEESPGVHSVTDMSVCDEYIIHWQVE